MGLIRRILTTFQNYSLQRKVFLTTSIVVCLAVPLTGAFSYNEASRILQDYAYNAADQTVNQLSGYMGNEMKNVSDRMYLINSSEAMKLAMSWSLNKTNEPYTKVFNTMFSLFSQMRTNSTSIKAIYMNTPRGDFFEGPFEKKNIPFSETPYYAAIVNSPKNVWVHSQSDPLFGGQGDVISLLTRPAADMSYLDQDSYLVMTLSTEKFVNNLKSIHLVPQGFSLILDELGKPLLMSEESSAVAEFIQNSALARLKDAPSHFEMDINKETVLVNHSEIPFTQWRAVVVQPKDTLLRKVEFIKYFTILMTVFLLIVSFLVNNWIAKWVTNRLRKLMMLMNKVKLGDLNVRFSSAYRDDIGELGNRFDEMLERIQGLLRQILEEGKAKRQAEMRALQAQINPHFLYNTLDELYWKSLEFEDPAAPEIILSLSRFFRLSLNKGKEETTIASEMEHVEHYLKLVNHQYKRQFTYDIEADPRAQHVLVPKIIMQPLVENCVLHAFKANEYKDFHIHVSCRVMESGTVILQVKDNGCGIPPERIKDFNESVQHADDSVSVQSGGYAIANIKERLLYFFGDRACLRAKSSLGAGTVMEIQIFCVKE
ncbi:sensor histidine kinase [Paenibacillus doosanensis]|uniref:Sensor histidine kinase YpdA n=1 Tax=Paenibacillus konkukensis TaxID=2020716 RepID=A0ABY4RLC9_9BACL|nr:MULTISPECIES: sensor histidine kinase [Paenibacillus]MCS7460050.1 sensor histidine kinase [Paenibacillus doosanensis]UQZ82705.1 Sensor histidine kinase YpdA [Paenibacillus konkukensis]